MSLRIYNTLTRTKEVFTPIDPTNVRMYVSGPTVYDYAHIGNARPAIVFDVLFRLLRHIYGENHVTYVRNITDVDDKINARALRDFPNLPLNEAIRKVTETTAAQYQKDVSALGCLAPTVQPRATEHIQGMVDMIRVLINRGHAYEAAGEVLFDVMAMKDYGALSGRKQDELKAGARVAVDAHKKNPSDFVLWKQSAADEPGWDSPWGRGRPGWHIECSVMSKAHLGEVFDIHGGGLDLIFPHHENEIAQSRCANGEAEGTKVMAKYWMHNGFLQVEGQKMSKSLGNFVTIADVLQYWPGEVARLNMLRTHYRQPIDWTNAGLQASLAMLDDLYLASASLPQDALAHELVDDRLVEALQDDLNTHAALTRLVQMRNELAHGASGFVQIELKRKMVASAQFLGLLKNTKDEWFRSREKNISAPKVDQLVSPRNEARKTKNIAEGDRIRDELLAMNIQIKDIKDPVTGELKTEWEVKR